MSITKPRNKKSCDPNCKYDCKECVRESKWLKAYERAERKEMKRLAREESKIGWREETN